MVSPEFKHNIGIMSQDYCPPTTRYHQAGFGWGAEMWNMVDGVARGELCL